MGLTKSKYGQSIKNQGGNVCNTNFHPALHGQPPSIPNLTGRIDLVLQTNFSPAGGQVQTTLQAGPSVQPKRPVRSRPFQAPNRKSDDLSRFILASVTFSYRSSAFCTASMSLRVDTKADTSSAYAETLARDQELQRTGSCVEP